MFKNAILIYLTLLVAIDSFPISLSTSGGVCFGKGNSFVGFKIT